MAKKVKAQVKLQLPAGKATPAPPVGPALGQYGVRLMDFCKEFNAKTAKQPGMIIPVVVTIFQDGSYTMELKTPPASALLKKACKLDKGASNPSQEIVGTISREEVKKIAETKMPDLNTDDIEAAMRIIEGTARSMGIKVEG